MTGPVAELFPCGDPLHYDEVSVTDDVLRVVFDEAYADDRGAVALSSYPRSRFSRDPELRDTVVRALSWRRSDVSEQDWATSRARCAAA